MKKLYVIIFMIAGLYIVNSQAYKVHVLKEGETLWRVSKNYSINIDELCKYNKIDDVTKVKIGAEIKIPNGKTPITSGPVMEKNSNGKSYLYFDMPLAGSVKLFTTSQYRGVLIFSDDNNGVVKAIGDGEVHYIDNIIGYGLTIIVKDKNNYLYVYSGFKEIYVKKNQKISSNEVIGKVGNLTRYKKCGMLFSIQQNDKPLKFDMEKNKFFID